MDHSWHLKNLADMKVLAEAHWGACLQEETPSLEARRPIKGCFSRTAPHADNNVRLPAHMSSHAQPNSCFYLLSVLQHSCAMCLASSMVIGTPCLAKTSTKTTCTGPTRIDFRVNNYRPMHGPLGPVCCRKTTRRATHETTAVQRRKLACGHCILRVPAREHRPSCHSSRV